MLFPWVPWSNMPSTACLSLGLLGFCLDAGNQLWICCSEPGKGFATCSILLAGLHSAPWLGGAAGEQLLLVPPSFPLAHLVQAESVSSPIPWPLIQQPGHEGVLTRGYPALFQVRVVWGNPR